MTPEQFKEIAKLLSSIESNTNSIEPIDIADNTKKTVSEIENLNERLDDVVNLLKDIRNNSFYFRQPPNFP